LTADGEVSGTRKHNRSNKTQQHHIVHGAAQTNKGETANDSEILDVVALTGCVHEFSTELETNKNVCIKAFENQRRDVATSGASMPSISATEHTDRCKTS
jgi:hypothetical protein